ncbi:MAG: hypothetical protein J5814_09525 [Bacteroidaceae bacterium]|nr:hypothetical protein [Bacteroidaceae bacterium]
MKRLFTSRLSLILSACFALLVSCVDKNYDLEGGISTDISIPGNVIDLPLGSLTPLTLDSLLASAGDMLSVVDGVYGISAEDSISPVTVELEPVRFQIDPVSEDIHVNLADVELRELTVPAFSNELSVEVYDISLSEVERSLPLLNKTVSFEESDVDFEELISSVALSGQSSNEIPSLQTVLFIESEEMPCSFSSPLPKGLKAIRTLYLGEAGSTSGTSSGTLMELTIRHPSKFSRMSKRIDAELVFPDEYELALSDNQPQRECYTLKEGNMGHRNVLSIKGLKGDGASTVIQFLAMSIEDLEPYCYSEELEEFSYSEKNCIGYQGNVTLSVNYTIDGPITILPSDNKEDYSASLSVDESLEIADAFLILDQFVSELEPQIVEFNTSFDELEYVDSVGTVTFEPEQSLLVLKTFTDKPYDVFEMDAEQPVVVQFPAEFHLELLNPAQHPGTVWDATRNMLTMNDLEGIFDKEYVFAVHSLDINTKIKDGVFEWQGVITVSTPGDVWKLNGKTSYLNDLSKYLGERILRVSSDECKWVVKDVSFATADISETFSESIPLNIDVSLPVSFIRKAYALWPSEDMELALALDVEGLEAITEPVEVTATIDYPDFICMESDDPDVTIENGSLTFNASVDMNHASIRKELRVTHFDFTSLPNGALEPVEEEGVSHLKLSETFGFEGKLHIGKTDISLSDLQSELSVHAGVLFSEVTLRLFEGILDYPLDPLETTLPFADKALGLLVDENSNLMLSESQIFFTLKNSVGVPLLLDVVLEGLDASGRVIEGSAVEIKDVYIKPAEYDEKTRQLTPVENKLLFTNKENVSFSDYTTVWVESLPVLLKKVPQSIHFMLTPRFDQSVKHHVDIVSPLEFAGSYKVSVPLRFDAISIKYESPGEGLQVSLGELTSHLSRASIGLKMDARNTVPLNLTLNLVPFDAEGKLLSGINVTPILLPAGDGSPISESAAVHKVEISLTGDDRSLHALSYLKIQTEASADHTEGGIALQPKQGILLTNIVLHLEADIDTTL